MQRLPQLVLVGVLLSSLVTTTPVEAALTTYTDTNFWNSPHEKPVSFAQDEWGNFYGATATGRLFSQVNVANTAAVRLQKFTIDEVVFYISDQGIIRANSDIIALSIYLTRLS